jgi:hypothetical protein
LNNPDFIRYYGTDVEIFSDDASKLNEIFEFGLLEIFNNHYMSVQGITIPTIFAGSYGCWFPLHFEDLNLYAANYMVEGDPKVIILNIDIYLFILKFKIWYGINSQYAFQVRELIATLFPQDTAEDEEYIRLKMYLIVPEIFKKNQIPYQRIVNKIKITFVNKFFLDSTTWTIHNQHAQLSSFWI